MTMSSSTTNNVLSNLSAAYDSLIRGQKVHVVPTTLNVQGLGNAQASTLGLTASQNLLRIGMIQISRQHGAHSGLNEAIDVCREDVTNDDILESVEPIETSAYTGIYRRSSGTFPADSSHSCVFDIEEASAVTLYPDDDQTESEESMVSFYANPNFGRGQRDHSDPTLKQGPPDLQESTEILLSPLISHPAVFIQSGEPDPSLESSEGTDEDDEFYDPCDDARTYTSQLLATVSEPDAVVRHGVLVTGAGAMVTNIPCDSWMTLVLRMLPGELVPHGLILFLPLFLTVLSILTLVFL